MSEWIMTSSVLIVFVMGIRYFFRRRLAFRVRYGLWLVVAVRLLVPVPLAESSVSVLNWLQFLPTADNISQTKSITGEQFFGEAQETAKDIDQGNVSRQEVGESEAVFGRTGEAGGESVSGREGDLVFRTNKNENTTMIPGEVKLSEAASFSERSRQEVGEGESVKAEGRSRAFLAGIWLLGAISAAGSVGFMNRQYRRRIYASRKRYDAADCRIPVYVSKEVDTPCMFGLLHPAVYLTPGAILDSKALGYVLCHEETHYRHGDHIWAVVRVLCICIHWFNPLVWLAAGLSRQDCELACDEETLERLGEEERICYGRTLLDFSAGESSLLGGLQLSTAVSGGKRQMKERLMMIVGRPKRHVGSLLAVLALAVLCTAVTFTGRVQGKTMEQEDDREIPETYDREAQEEPVESVAIVSVNLGDGEKYVLKVSGETDQAEADYKILRVELNRVGNGEEETLQSIHPEETGVLYTGPSGAGEGKTLAAQSLYAKPLYKKQELGDNTGAWLSASSDGAIYVADLNFDGYDDFCLRAGEEGVNIPYYCYLWDPDEKQFVPAYMIPNVRVNREGLIESAVDHGGGLRAVNYYRFDEYNVLHLVRRTEEDRSPGAFFSTLDLTYEEVSYALPAVDEWDRGTAYAGALAERIFALAKQALTELYELTGTKLDTACFCVSSYGDVMFGQTPDDVRKSRIFYSRVYGAEAGFEECIPGMSLSSERVVWYSPVTFWQVPEGMEHMTDLQAAEWYFEHSALTGGETVKEIAEDGGEYIFAAQSGRYYSLQLHPATRELEAVYGPYDSYPMH